MSTVARTNVRAQRRAGYLACSSYLTLTLVIGAAALGCMAVPRTALAADWTGGGTISWFDPTNWNPATVPTAGDNTVINSPAWAWVSGGAAATANNVVVGQSTNGGLQFATGGTLTSTTGIIGDQAGSSGIVKVFDAGSAWTNSGNLTIGKNGDGQLFVHNGGTVSNLDGYVGDRSGSTGVVEIKDMGSTWNNSGSLTVGNSGTGKLDVLNGGAVFSNQGVLGLNSSSNSSMTVDGLGSIWTNSGLLTVGGDGTAHLTISNKGKVQNTSAFLGAGSGSGTVDVTGAGSAWINNGDLDVGAIHSGTLNISNGGVVSNHFGYVGDSVGSTGVVKVDGLGSTWTNSSDLVIGSDGNGTLTISNGGAVSNSTGRLGQGTGSGTATVDGAGSIWTNSAMFTVGYNGTGALTISNGGVVSAPGAELAKNAGSTGTINIGAAAGSPATGAGKLDAATLQFGAGTGTLNFNHTDVNYAFDAAMSGLGTINQLAGNTDLTANSSGFTGATNVLGGRLAVNGSLANSLVTVSGNGILGGNGTVGGIDAQAGGIIAPGNSIGTLNVNGNLNQAAGSIYRVELTSTGQSDFLHATGTATIANGALLGVVKLDAVPFVLGTQYTVLQADGGITGTYTMLSPSTFIGVAASYDPTHVYLNVTQAKSFASVGLTRNQIATGAATEALAAGNAIYDAVLMSPTDAAARTAFDQLSGDIHASVKGVLLDDSRFPREAAINRLRSAFGSVGASSSPVMAYASSGPVSVAPDTDRFAVWGQGFGSWGQWRGDGNAARLDRSTGGFIAGADGLAFDTWRFGLFGGYSRTSFDAKDSRSSGSSDNYHIGLYDGTQWGNLAIRSGLAYTWHDLSTNRNVALPGFSDTLKGNTNAGTAQAFGELGYSIKAGQIAFEPFANLAYVSLRTNGFTETGGAAALTSSRSISDATFTTLGLRASSNVTLGTVNATARGSLGWRHAFGDTTPLSALAFASGGSAFTIAGVPIAQDAAVVDVGLDFNVARDTLFGISFGSQFGSGVNDQTIRANFSSKF